MQLLWLTNLETSEQVGIATDRLLMVEQKSPSEGYAVALHLDTGKELRVMESLADVRAMIDAMSVEKDLS